MNVMEVNIMMSISEISKAQVADGTLSRNISGNGLYLFLSGNLSWTRASEVVVRIKFTANIRNAETKPKIE